ncbi:MAG: hypothetical protein H0W76_20160 [Pyrinomonadaceae bacterium]|nr:hypothetical protein [Pyrinomonadaceae bacterium]
MRKFIKFAAMTMAVMLMVMIVALTGSFAANHREAPITALDLLAGSVARNKQVAKSISVLRTYQSL